MSVRDNYTMINIREYLALGTDEEVGEPALVRLLSDFSCPKNPDVEYFLKKNAIEFTKKNQSVTYLVFSNDEGELIGYFSIALKPLTVRGETVSNTVKRKLLRISELDEKSQTYTKLYENLEATISNQRTSVSGVDEDEEALNLVKFQNAYNMSSKVISVMKELLDKLINETGV